ncbi:hypothetical protein P9265_00010 [Schinkia azotoformans]|uniref:hypothetical protein n=1 Tax=Schinkia azotoformans TaxID=1454 RepID=UPI002E23FECF|nr:hypothetical protein [Schinkia azotoformans]
MEKSYVFKQFTCILFLFLFAFIADYYIQNVNIDIDSVEMKQSIMFIAISILLFVCNQFIYNYAKKEEGFMQHKVWNKMFIVILIWLMISFIVFIFLFFTTPLESLISSHAWMMFIVAYYFLFFINLLVLSIVHVIVDTSMKVEKKLIITWASSSLVIAIILFGLPSF